MPKGLQHKGIVRKNKMLREGVRLFLERGYTSTTTAAIAKATGMSGSSFFAAFESKEAMLLELVKVMFKNQFASAEMLHDAQQDPVLLYCIETSIQMYIAELSAPLRELYVEAYSLPSTSEYIYQSTAEKLKYIFAKYLPGAQMKDFYEMEIASSGITRAFMAKECDLYFTMENKLDRYLQSCLTLYRVPDDQQKQFIAQTLQMNLKPIAEKIIASMVEKVENELDILLEEEEAERGWN